MSSPLFTIDLGTPVSSAVDWLTQHLGGLFDAISSVMTELVNAVLFVLTAPHALVVTAVFTVLAFLARKWGFAAFTVVAFLLIQGMGLWTEAMQSLAVVLVASVLAVAIGVPIGVWAARGPVASAVVRPVLDFMQTLPVFVYLIPAVFFFGIGLVPGVVATTVFAVPPAVRLTELGIRQVDKEVVEAAHAFGAKPRQILREVQLPLALPSIMAGVNQVIMLALSMVVIAGMVGAAGLGTVVVRGISQLDVGVGFQGGLAVVFLAIFLDRVTGALAAPRRRRRRKNSTRPTPAADATSAPVPAPEPAVAASA
ncbi:ABC transporter permease [Streptomyces flaveus]|uniref:ABC transporter permease n=1 Tax=Streptomyces flaveus TaxID=66370 RepID=UPI00331804C5